MDEDCKSSIKKPFGQIMTTEGTGIRLSFIVPCYNVESFLQRCLNTLFSCGLPVTEYEVLAIDDCSPDGSLDILRRNAESHPELRIISHSVNKGLGGARNTGIENAKGDYLWFVDADDMVKGDYVEKALRRCVFDGLDVLAFNYCKINLKDEVLSRHLVFSEMPVQDGPTFASKAFHSDITRHMGYVWRFIYRTDFIRSQGLSFPEKTYWEDTVFMPEAIIKSERVASIPDVLYSYRVNPESISGSFSKNYPAKMIYDYVFYCGKELLRLAGEIQDHFCKELIKKAAVKQYICGFPIFLFRTSKVERREFYSLLDRKETKALAPWMDWLSRLLLFPFIGPIISDILSFVYKKEHKRG